MPRSEASAGCCCNRLTAMLTGGIRRSLRSWRSRYRFAMPLALWLDSLSTRSNPAPAGAAAFSEIAPPSCRATIALPRRASAGGSNPRKRPSGTRSPGPRRAGSCRSGADVDALARFLMSGFQGLRLVGKVNPNRAVLEDIATMMLRCLESPAPTGRQVMREGHRA